MRRALPQHTMLRGARFTSHVSRLPVRLRRAGYTSLLIFLIGSGRVSHAWQNFDNLTAPTDGSEVVKGFGISPQGFPLDYSKLADFYSEVGDMMNGGVMWNGAWRVDVVNGTDAGTIPEAAPAVMQSSSAFNFTPIVVFGWRSGTTLFIKVPANSTNDWTNTEAKNLFQSMLVEFVTTYNPPFLFLGNESDSYYEQNPADYANWITFYNTAYEAIKAVSAATLVGPVFNFEHLAGLGALNGWTTPFWEALDSHDLTKVDIVGVTVYPWLNYASANSVPSTYLDPLISRIGSKPIAITETGWPAENLGDLNPAWETSETAQITYLSQISFMLQGKNLNIVNWLFLHMMVDPGGSPIEWKLFGSVSIRDSAGNKRPVYDQWVAYDPTTSVEDQGGEIPKTFALFPNYPNPFNPTTTIQFDLPVTSQVWLIIHNPLGQRVRQLNDGRLGAGQHQITWDGLDDTGKNVSSGVYFIKMTARTKPNTSEFVQVRKMLLLK